MRISTDSPYGLTGSEFIEGLYVYVSEDSFTPDDLPAPIMSNTTSYSGYTVTFPQKDVPYWIMWGYRGRSGQMSYSPAIRLIDFSDGFNRAFNGFAQFRLGDANFGALTNTLASTDLVYADMFSIIAGIDYRWDRGNSQIGWYILDGELHGVTTLPNKDVGTAIEMYTNGYLTKSDAELSQYSPTMTAALTPSSPQGRTVPKTNMTWSAVVPTLDEFQWIFGSVFQSGIPTSAPAFSGLALNPNVWYLTSSESADTPGTFWAINYAGGLKTVTPTEAVSIYLLFGGTVNP